MRRSKQALQKKTSAEWIEILNKAGMPCGPIYNIDQVFADPQVKHLGVAADGRAPEARPQADPGERRRRSRARRRKVVAPTPEIGEHTDEVLQELKYNAAEIAKLREGGVV